MDSATEFLAGIVEALEAIRDRLTPRYIGCKDCVFWMDAERSTAPGVGYCFRRAPPHHQNSINIDGPQVQWMPEIHRDYGCGEGARRVG
ncbi:MAG TPA: hypothetical protein PLI83_02725 [Thermomonas sp.]|nr:hypothetical protein [Thermomonas sp.]